MSAKPSARQRQLLSAMAGRRAWLLTLTAPIEIMLVSSGHEDVPWRVSTATFDALLRNGWVGEVREPWHCGGGLFGISDAGLEAIRDPAAQGGQES